MATQFTIDFNQARAHMSSILSRKLAFWQQLPWRLCSLAVPDEDEGRRHAALCMQAFEATTVNVDMPEHTTQHRVARKFLSQSSSLRQYLERWVAGEHLAALEPLKNELSKLMLIPVVERIIEARGNHVRLAFATLRHSGLRASIALRFAEQQLHWSQDSSTFLAFQELWKEVRSLRKIPQLLGPKTWASTIILSSLSSKPIQQNNDRNKATFQLSRKLADSTHWVSQWVKHMHCKVTYAQVLQTSFVNGLVSNAIGQHLYSLPIRESQKKSMLQHLPIAEVLGLRFIADGMLDIDSGVGGLTESSMQLDGLGDPLVHVFFRVVDSRPSSAKLVKASAGAASDMQMVPLMKCPCGAMPGTIDTAAAVRVTPLLLGATGVCVCVCVLRTLCADWESLENILICETGPMVYCAQSLLNQCGADKCDFILTTQLLTEMISVCALDLFNSIKV
eukprot:3908398-Amphidinium_carterae.2